MTRIFLTNDIRDEKTAASKARVDVLDILKGEGYQTLYLPRKMNIANIRMFWKQLSSMAKGDTHVVIEYPISMKRRMYLVYLICRMKGIKLYGVIHDVASLRSQTSPKRDMTILNLFNGLISHNASMTAWLREKGFKKKIVDLGVFDYKLDHPKSFNERSVNGSFKIFYAGNLSYKKARFIYDERLGDLKKVQFNLYGQEFDREKINGSKINYKGVFNPGTPDLPENYHFGLIWEGTSLDTCDGELGEYIRFNNPHKFSLYISLGLPVIVWKEAAIAAFVLENEIGLTIANFNELENISAQVTPEKYSAYVQNIEKLAEKVRSGYFLKTAINQLVKS